MHVAPFRSNFVELLKNGRIVAEQSFFTRETKNGTPIRKKNYFIRRIVCICYIRPILNISSTRRLPKNKFQSVLRQGK